MINKTIDPQLGQRLRQIREARGMSQSRLAKAIGMTTGIIQMYEHGRVQPTAYRFDQIAQELRCKVANLLEPPDAPLPHDRRYSRQHAKPTANALLSIAPKTLGFYGRPAHSTAIFEADVHTKAICGVPADAPNEQAWQRWYNRIDTDDHARVNAELARLNNPRDGVFNMQYRLLGLDGVERCVIDYGCMIFDSAGEPVRLRGLMLDITQERRTQSTDDKIAQILVAFNAAAED